MPKAKEHKAFETAGRDPHRLLKTVFLAAAVLVVGSIAVIYWVGVLTLQAEREMTRQLQTLTLLSNTGSTFKDAETGQRGFLLTGEDRYLEPYNTALLQLQTDLDGLQKLARTGGLPDNNVQRVIALWKEKWAELDKTIRLRRTGGLQAALPVVRDGRGKELMDQIRAELSGLQSRAQAQFNKSAEQAAWTGRLRTVVFLVFGALDGAFLAWSYRKISSESRQREAAARNLRESEERTRLIVETALDAVITMDDAGAVTGWNPQAETTFGWKREQAIGRSLQDIIIPERFRNGHEQGLQRFLATGEGPVKRIELTALRQDGNKFPIELAITPMKLGNHVSYSAFLRDISERKQAEIKLQAQLARLGLLSDTTRAIGERQDLQSIFQVVIRSLEDNLPIDFGCVCLYDGLSETLTVTSVGIKSQPLAFDLALTEKAEVPIDENGLSRCIRGQLVYEPDISNVNFAFPQRLFRGGLRAVVIAPLLVESSVFGVLIAGRRAPHSFSSTDCEFLRQLSEHVALAANQAQLHTSLQRAYHDLRQTQVAVMQQERLRALGQMASGIAHDINNAISPVALYTQSLLEKETTLSERARNYLQTIKHAIDDVAATVARMREFYRQREPQLMLTPVDLNRLAGQVIELTRARWSDMPQQRGVSLNLVTEFAPDLPETMGVESEIREALTNLIFNAADAMPEGGTLTLRTRAAQSDTGSRVQIEVADTGVGMDEDTRRRCLEPFFTTKGERGTGLGLAMVYGMVKRHSAEMEIESKPGKGATFRLSFAVQMSSISDSEPESKPPIVPSRLRILVVDDDPLLLKSLSDTLEEDGHVVTTANGGGAGIETFKSSLEGKEHFSAVITDLGMPYVDGRKVASAIKSVSPSTPVILLTGWGQRLVEEKDIPDHVDRVLNKPPKLQLLREALAHCCSDGNPQRG